MDAVETMGYVGATPWHSKGNAVTDEGAMYSAPLFITACGLNWEAEKRQLSRKVGTDGAYELANAWEVVRKSDGKILADMVGERYTILQNIEAFSWFQGWLDAKEAALHTGGALFGGSRIWALAKLNRDPMEIAAGDIVEKYVLLSHSHDGSLAIRVGFTPIRVVCHNTLSMAHKADASKLIRLKHSKNVHTNLENLKEEFKERFASRSEQLGTVEERIKARIEKISPSVTTGQPEENESGSANSTPESSETPSNESESSETNSSA